MTKKVIGIIPARYASKRFPGKPLAPLQGKPLIQWTYENAKKSTLLSDLYVATDDAKIFDLVCAFGGKAVMTPSTCSNGTERIHEALKDPLLNQAEMIVNIQGDEPLIEPKIIEQVISALSNSEDAVCSTCISEISDPELIQNSSIVKCVTDLKGYALYFSRSPIPFSQEKSVPIYRHIGLYCYRTSFLKTYTSLPETPLQKSEDLEQLKILEHGFRIKTVRVNQVPIGVDTPQDLERLKEYICQ